MCYSQCCCCKKSCSRKKKAPEDLLLLLLLVLLLLVLLLLLRRLLRALAVLNLDFSEELLLDPRAAFLATILNGTTFSFFMSDTILAAVPTSFFLTISS